MIPAIKKFFIGNQLNSYDEKLKAAQGLIEVKKWLYDQRLNRITEYQYIYLAINAEFKKLGPVDPKIHAGEGFVFAIDRSQKLQDFYKNIDLKRDNSIFKFKNYKTYSDVILQNMICGPDLNKNESLINKTWGFSAHFNSPRITHLISTVKDSDSVCSHYMFTPLFQKSESKAFAAPFYLNKNKMVIYQSPFEYLKFNILPELYNTDFNVWWENQTQNQMTAAFNEFKNQYNMNIKKLLERINLNKNSKWNVSETVANGLMINIFQELRTYLLILGEIQKDHINPNNKNLNLKSENQIDYLKLLSRGSYLDFEQTFKSTDEISLKKALSNKIDFQIKMEGHFAELNSLIRRLESKPIDQKVVISGQLSNADFDPILEKIEKLNNLIAKEFGVSSKENSTKSFEETFNISENQANIKSPSSTILLNENTQEVVVKLLEYIQGLAYEIKTYGLLINAVNFDQGKK